MKFHHLLLLFILPLSFFCLFSHPVSASPIPNYLRGVAPQDEKYYLSTVIKCNDGSKIFDKEKLNDDFCDCPDGTDEPGTSACPDGRFFCQNQGHVPLILFSSRVNDGMCDCCDGSDEYDGKVDCPNVCQEAGKVARDELLKKIQRYQEGVAIRKKEVEKAKQAVAMDEAELSRLKDEEKILEGLVGQLRVPKEQIEKAEGQENREKEEEAKRLKEAKRNASKKEKHQAGSPQDETDEVENEISEEFDQDASEDNGDGVVGNENGHQSGTGSEVSSNDVLKQDASEDNGDGVVGNENGHQSGTGSEASSNDVLKQDEDKPNETEGLSREELGRLVASRWTGEKVDHEPEELESRKGVEHEDSQEVPDITEDDDIDNDYNGQSSKADVESQEYSDGYIDDAISDDDDDPLASYDTYTEDKVDFSDAKTPSSPSWLDKIQQTVQKILQAVPLFKTPVDKLEADEVKRQYDESSIKLSDVKSRISTLTEKLRHDYGKENEFYLFHDQCFENKQSQYVYKVCPYKRASQEQGYSTTQLGRWEKFNESYTVMLFTDGDSCWNGPDGSMKVQLRCGLSNKLTDVDEPSRCEYVAVLSTPVLCLEEKLKELQNELHLMSTNQSQSHDEM